jgi:hypothetical protein
MEKIIEFDTTPAKDDLIKQFEKFVGKNPKFKGMIKIGKTYSKNIHLRYKEHEKYEQLTIKSIFCKSKSESVALEIEKSLQNYAKEKGKLYKSTDVGDGVRSQAKYDSFVVYVTVMKSEEDKCSFCDIYVDQNKKIHVQKNHIHAAIDWKKKKDEIIEKGLDNTREGKEFIGIATKYTIWLKANKHLVQRRR